MRVDKRVTFITIINLEDKVAKIKILDQNNY
jgi:hypothetical protein